MDCPFYPPSLEFQAVHPLNPCSLIFRLEPVRNHRRDGAPVPNLAHPRWLTIATNPHAPQAPALKFRGQAHVLERVMGQENNAPSTRWE